MPPRLTSATRQRTHPPNICAWTCVPQPYFAQRLSSAPLPVSFMAPVHELWGVIWNSPAQELGEPYQLRYFLAVSRCDTMQASLPPHRHTGRGLVYPVPVTLSPLLPDAAMRVCSMQTSP